MDHPARMHRRLVAEKGLGNCFDNVTSSYSCHCEPPLLLSICQANRGVAISDSADEIAHLHCNERSAVQVSGGKAPPSHIVPNHLRERHF